MRSTRFLILTLLCAAVLPVSLHAQGNTKVDVTGKWSFTVESPAGTGTLKDGKIRFSFDAESGGQAFTMMFDGALDGADAMKGGIDFSGMATGAFSGKRQKP